MLPKTQRAWSSWNYRLKPGNGRATVTYNMNILQGLDAPETFCVTLNDTASINPHRILGRFNYAHPQFTLAGMKPSNGGAISTGKTVHGSAARTGKMGSTRMV